MRPCALAGAVLVALVAACGEKPLSTGLHVTVTNVGWEQVSDEAWKMVGARVDVDCELGRMVVAANRVERDREPSVTSVCNAIRLDQALLHPAATPPCGDYSTGTVTVTGNWQGRDMNLRFPTCEEYRPGSGRQTDPGQRWAHMLGFYFQGPDPPA